MNLYRQILQLEYNHYNYTRRTKILYIYIYTRGIYIYTKYKALNDIITSVRISRARIKA